jgi:hypothetical protein
MRIACRLMKAGLAAAVAACAFTIGGFALAAGSAKVVTLKGNHPTELARLGPVVRADTAMELRLSIVLGIHDQAKLDQLLARSAESFVQPLQSMAHASTVQSAVWADRGADGRRGAMA